VRESVRLGKLEVQYNILATNRQFTKKYKAKGGVHKSCEVTIVHWHLVIWSVRPQLLSCALVCRCMLIGLAYHRTS
jgi:hypothetical protein